jgi:hypothetical protein
LFRKWSQTLTATLHNNPSSNKTSSTSTSKTLRADSNDSARKTTDPEPGTSDSSSSKSITFGGKRNPSTIKTPSWPSSWGNYHLTQNLLCLCDLRLCHVLQSELTGKGNQGQAAFRLRAQPNLIDEKNPQRRNKKIIIREK